MQGIADILNSKDELSAIVRGHIHIELLIIEYLKVKKPRGKLFRKVRPKYSALLNMARQKGFPGELVNPLRELGELRNNFAHHLPPRLLHGDVDRLLALMPQPARYKYAERKQLLFVDRYSPRNRLRWLIIYLYGAVSKVTDDAKNLKQSET